jgi:hypothetical protein
MLPHKYVQFFLMFYVFKENMHLSSNGIQSLYHSYHLNVGYRFLENKTNKLTSWGALNKTILLNTNHLLV